MAKITGGYGAIDVEKAALVLSSMDSYNISEERAFQLANEIAVDGMIGE
jgi:hypothetical protein